MGVRKMLKDKSRKPTKKLSLKTITLKDLKQVKEGLSPAA